MAVTFKDVVRIASLSAATLVLLTVFITNGLAGSSNAERYGFKNTTGVISDLFFTQITPAGFTFIIWGVIYTWQTLWILYAWSFTFRPAMTPTICFAAYISYAILNIWNVVWIYLWGNELVGAALGVFVVFNFFHYLTIAILAYYLQNVEETANKVDVWLTRILPLNGVIFYATWTTLASLINLAVVLEYHDGVSASASGTTSLVLLTLVLVLYFIAENTILDKYFRYVFSVYPVVIWALIGVLSKQWPLENNQTNKIFELVLLIVAAVLALARIVLFVIFSFVRSPCKKTEKMEMHS